MSFLHWSSAVANMTKARSRQCKWPWADTGSSIGPAKPRMDGGKSLPRHLGSASAEAFRSGRRRGAGETVRGEGRVAWPRRQGGERNSGSHARSKPPLPNLGNAVLIPAAAGCLNLCLLFCRRRSEDPHRPSWSLPQAC